MLFVEINLKPEKSARRTSSWCFEKKKKKTFGRIFRSKVQNLTRVFSILYMIRIRIFGPNSAQYTLMVGLSFSFCVWKCHKLRTSVSLLILRTFCEMTRCSATAWSRVRTHYWSLALSLGEQVPALMERIVLEVVHPVQYGIVPERITFPRPDDEILSGYD